MEVSKSELSLDNLNKAYVALIQDLITEQNSSIMPQLNKFLSNPSPTQSFSILNQLNQEKGTRRKRNLFKIHEQIQNICEIDKKQDINFKNIQPQCKVDDVKRINSKQSTVSNAATSSGSEKIIQNRHTSFDKIESLRSITLNLTTLFAKNEKKIYDYESNLKL